MEGLCPPETFCVVQNGENTSFLCRICNKTYPHLSNLKKHFVVHSGVKPFVCEECNRRFSRKSTLKNHLITHWKVKPFSCNICCKTFIKSSNLVKHHITHVVDKSFKCDICNKGFPCEYYLKRHQTSHSNERPYSCDVCASTFAYKSDLKRHSFIHTGEKPNECEICQKRFAHKTHLKNHYLTHTNEKPHECEMCAKRFGRKTSLQRHYVKVHNRDKISSEKDLANKNNLPDHILVGSEYCGQSPSLWPLPGDFISNQREKSVLPITQATTIFEEKIVAENLTNTNVQKHNTNKNDLPNHNLVESEYCGQSSSLWPLSGDFISNQEEKSDFPITQATTIFEEKIVDENLSNTNVQIQNNTNKNYLPDHNLGESEHHGQSSSLWPLSGDISDQGEKSDFPVTQVPRICE